MEIYMLMNWGVVVVVFICGYGFVSLFQWLRNNFLFNVYFWVFAETKNREMNIKGNSYQTQFLFSTEDSWLKNSVSHMTYI
jgi:hypothetical protein